MEVIGGVGIERPCDGSNRKALQMSRNTVNRPGFPTSESTDVKNKEKGHRS